MTILFGNIFFSADSVSLLANVQTENNTEEVNFVQEEIKNEIWQIEIPKINLVADISEGTSAETLNYYVGHFEETKKINGNVGLAAHNRGYNVNYFERVKELELDDEIIYTIDKTKRIYKVSLITIIDDTDWTNLENTEDNRLTLITCLENEPSKRRCIQAIEKE